MKPAEQQPDRGRRTDQEALLVAGEGIDDRCRDEQDVERVHGSTCQRSRSRSELCTMTSGRSITREVSHGALPARQVEQPVEQCRGEAPDHEAPHQEPRSSVSGGMVHGDPVGWVERARRWARCAPTPSRRDRRRGPDSGRATSASTGVTTKLLGGSHKAGSSPKTSTPDGSRPGLLLGFAQARRRPRRRRRDLAIRPGNATWPACERMSCDRSVSNTSGPSAPSPNRISTDAGRAEPSGGRRELGAPLRERTRLTLGHGSSQAGSSGAAGRCDAHEAVAQSSSMPRCSAEEFGQLGLGLDRSGLVIDDLAVGIDEQR